MKDEFRPDLERVKKALERAGLLWAVAAGAGVFLYTGHRSPTDLDLLVRPEDLASVADLLGLTAKIERSSWGEVSKVAFGQTEIVGELVVKIGGEDYRYWLDEEMIRRTRRVTLEGVEVPVLSPEDLVALKAVLQRGPEQGKHDLEDIEALVASVPIDLAALNSRLGRMGAVERAKPVLERLVTGGEPRSG